MNDGVMVGLTRCGTVPRFFLGSVCMRYLLDQFNWLSGVGGRLGIFYLEELVFGAWFESVALDLLLVLRQLYRQKFD